MLRDVEDQHLDASIATTRLSSSSRMLLSAAIFVKRQVDTLLRLVLVATLPRWFRSSIFPNRTDQAFVRARCNPMHSTGRLLVLRHPGRSEGNPEASWLTIGLCNTIRSAQMILQAKCWTTSVSVYASAPRCSREA